MLNINSLKQDSAHYSLWAKFSSAPALVNKVLLEHSCYHYLHNVSGTFVPKMQNERAAVETLFTICPISQILSEYFLEKPTRTKIMCCLQETHFKYIILRKIS